MGFASLSPVGDLLIRTTLRLEGGPVPLALQQAVRALQRVPGVLTVDSDVAGATVLVAHDAAVPLSSLVAAATVAGTATTVVREARLWTSEPTTLLPKSKNQSHLWGISMAVILAVILFDVALPNNLGQRWLMLAPLAVLWTIVVVKEVVGRGREAD